MARSGWNGPSPISDLTAEILDPVLRKRAGMSLALVQSWQEVVGTALGERTRPEKIVWPRRAHEDDPFEPATLVIACEGMAALQLQHQTGEIIGRVNAFLGFAAVGRIRIVQKPVTVAAKPERPRLRPLATEERQAVAETVSGIAHESLKASLQRLGETVRASRRPRS